MTTVGGAGVVGASVVGAGVTPGASASPGCTMIVWVVVRACGGSSSVTATKEPTSTPSVTASKAASA